MPYLSFFANGMWVLILGILGPSIPSIVESLGITYSQAGLFFTVLSLGSIFGTSLGAAASDYLNRKKLFLFHCCALFAGLLATGFSLSYFQILTAIFFMSLLGSPIGAVGQSIMLSIFPEKREKYLSIQTFFAAAGSFLAPLIVAVLLAFRLSWRGAFVVAAGGIIVLFLSGLKLSVPGHEERTLKNRGSIKILFQDKRLLFIACCVFLCIGPDIGFSYWLSELYKSDLQVSMRLSSAVISVYLAGVALSRISVPIILKKLNSAKIIGIGTAIALVSLLCFSLIPSVIIRTIFVFIYGLGIGPVFPMLLSRGTRLYPERPGIITGLLFASMSLGGMVFPLLIGAAAESLGIVRAYGINAVILLFFSITHIIKKRDLRNP